MQFLKEILIIKCSLQAEAEMDDLTLWQQQQQDLERQKLVSVMAAGIHVM